MPLLGGNRASDLANVSMDPDRAWLLRFRRPEPHHKVLDVKRERKSPQIFHLEICPKSRYSGRICEVRQPSSSQMLSPMYIFSAHNIRLALLALHDDLEALHCSSDEPNMRRGRVSARQGRGPRRRRVHR